MIMYFYHTTLLRQYVKTCNIWVFDSLYIFDTTVVWLYVIKTPNKIVSHMPQLISVVTI